jgi:ABC-2 type transport system permease protein
MPPAVHIFKKELKTYFLSPIAYIVIAIFLVITGWFFFTTFFLVNQANMRNFFGLLPLIFSFVVPAVTMKLFSEELNIGSYETLLTLPVTFNDVILGKFLASTAFVACMLIPTLAYPLCIAFVGQLDWGPVVGGYIGALLLGAGFCAVGLWTSAMTKNQIVAFIMAMAICFILVLFNRMLFFLPPDLLGFFAYLGATTHFDNIAKGVIDSRDFIYFFSLVFIGLYATYLAMDAKN